MKKTILNKNISRNKLYFDQFKYSVDFFLQDLPALRTGDPQGIQEWVNRERFIRRNFGGSWFTRYNSSSNLTQETIENLYNALTFFKGLDGEYKLKISMNNGYFYTNNKDHVSEISKLSGLHVIETKKVKLDVPANSIYRKNSSYKIRTYFKTQRISSDDKKKFADFILKRNDVRCCPSLQEWLEKMNASRYIMDNFFVDYNDQNILLMLQLVCPLDIKETYNIINDK